MKKLAIALLSGSAALTAYAGNPAITDVFTADPAPIVHDGTVYVYVGQDEAKPGEGYTMNRWLVYSSEDMVNWKSHGSPLKPTDFEWSSGSAWAGHTIEKDGKFYWYTTSDHKTVHGKAIGRRQRLPDRALQGRARFGAGHQRHDQGHRHQLGRHRPRRLY
jgi:beta-xylosidase